MKLALLILILIATPRLSSAAAVIFNEPEPTKEQSQELISVVANVVDTNADKRVAQVRTDQGNLVQLQLADDGVCLRVAAGEKTLTNAASIQFSDIARGDRVLVRGSMSADQKQFTAQRVVVLTKAEIEKKRQHDLSEWRRRGVAGVVKTVDGAGLITLELRGSGPPGMIAISARDADFRRYSTQSSRFEDARPSWFAEIKPGDQLRALGDKSADGHSLKAEAIVSGAFKTIGATVTGVDLLKNQIIAVTLDQKRPLTVSMNKDSALRRIPPPLAQAIAQSLKGPSAQPAQNAIAQKPAAPQSLDVQQVIDSLPGLSLGDIKPGDVVAITTAIDTNTPDRTIAIKLVAGVDLV